MRKLSVNYGTAGHFFASAIMIICFIIFAPKISSESIPQNLFDWGIFIVLMVSAEVVHELLHGIVVVAATRNFNAVNMRIRLPIGSCYEVIRPVSRFVFIISLLAPICVAIVFLTCSASAYWSLFFLLNVFGSYFDLVLLTELIKVRGVLSITSTEDEGTIVFVQ